MKTFAALTSIVALTLCTASGGTVDFPDGNFSNGTPADVGGAGSASGIASNWIASVDVSGGGLIPVGYAGTFNNAGVAYGRLVITPAALAPAQGLVSLRHGNIADFEPSQIYRVSFRIACANFSSLANADFGVQVLDGQGRVVAQLVGANLIAAIKPDVTSFQPAELVFSTPASEPTGKMQILVYARMLATTSYTVSVADFRITASAADKNGVPEVSSPRFTWVDGKLLFRGAIVGGATVSSIEYRIVTKTKKGTWRSAPVAADKWRAVLKPRTKAFVVQFRATDSLGNRSQVTSIRVKRPR